MCRVRNALFKLLAIVSLVCFSFYWVFGYWFAKWDFVPFVALKYQSLSLAVVTLSQLYFSSKLTSTSGFPGDASVIECIQIMYSTYQYKGEDMN